MKTTTSLATLLLSVASLVGAQTDYQTHIEPWLHGDGIYPSGIHRNLDRFNWQLESRDRIIAFSEQMRAEQERELAEAEQFAATNSFGFTLYLTNAQGEVTGQMIAVDGEVPRYLTTYNLEAAGGVGTTHLWPGGLSGFALDGAGSEIALWDQGIPRLTHVEFTTNGIDGGDVGDGSTTPVRPRTVLAAGDWNGDVRTIGPGAASAGAGSDKEDVLTSVPGAPTTFVDEVSKPES